jgi:hypothetical protein
VETDPSDEVEYRAYHRYGKLVYTAPPFPRDIPGVPREYNLKGVSFAVARVSAKVASAWFHDSGAGGQVLVDHGMGVSGSPWRTMGTAPTVPH